MIFIKKLYKYISKIYLSAIVFIIISIVLMQDKLYYQAYSLVFESDINFQYIKSKSKYLLGSIVDNKSHFVSSNRLVPKNIVKKDNSYYLYLDSNYVISNFNSGVVTFIGKKDNLGNTVIVSSDNGINYWYSNIENISVNLYDYIETDTIIGSIIDDHLILTLMGNNRYLNYEDYY